jgi:hypothetical protein
MEYQNIFNARLSEYVTVEATKDVGSFLVGKYSVSSRRLIYYSNMLGRWKVRHAIEK